MSTLLKQREAWDCLLCGLDAKTRMAGTEVAISWLEKAQAAARGAQITPTLSAIINYRLAHAKLRLARSLEDLEDIDALLTAAVRPRGGLRIMPLILRLAVLHRLTTVAHSNDQAEYSRAANNLWPKIAESLQDVERSAHEKPIENNSVLQSVPFNMAELAAYFIGADTNILEGVAPRDVVKAVFDGLSSEPDYILCDNQTVERQLRTPRELAVDQVQEILAAKMADVGFIIDDDFGYAFFADGQKFARGKAVLVFAVACGAICRTVADSVLDSGYFSRASSRINKATAKAGLADYAVSSRQHSYVFNPELRVVGAISATLMARKHLDPNWGKERFEDVIPESV